MIKRSILLTCLFLAIQAGKPLSAEEKPSLGYRSLPGAFFDPNNYVDLYIAYESLTKAYSASTSLAIGLQLEKEALDKLWQAERSLRLKGEAQAKRDQLQTIFIAGGAGLIAGGVFGAVLIALIKK